MKRNINNTITKGEAIARNHRQADASVNEVQVFYDRLASGEDSFKVLNDLLNFGVAIGYRMKEGEKE